MHHSSRREFLKTGIAASVLAGAASGAATKRSATDLVQLGKSNVRVTRLAFGTGTNGGRGLLPLFEFRAKNPAFVSQPGFGAGFSG